MSDIKDPKSSPRGIKTSKKKGNTLKPEWNKTLLVQERLQQKGLYEEPDRESKKNYYLGRHTA